MYNRSRSQRIKPSKNRIFWNCNEGDILWQYGYKRLYLGNHADIQSSLGLTWWLDGYVKCGFWLVWFFDYGDDCTCDCHLYPVSFSRLSRKMAHLTYCGFIYSSVYRDLFLYLVRAVPCDQKANSRNQSKIILNLKLTSIWLGWVFSINPKQSTKIFRKFR